MPASVIGLVLLFVLLCTGAVKLGEVEKVGTTLTNNIGLLFVPAGISVVNSLGVISQAPFLIIGTNNRLNNTITYLYWLCHTNYYESYFEI